MRKIFYAQFFNTGIYIVLMSAAFPELQDSVTGSIFSGAVFDGNLEDLTPQWYLEAGAYTRPRLIST